MDPDTLRQQLAALHDELRRTRQVDPRSSALLAEVLRDIQRILDDRTEPPSAPPSATIAEVAPGGARAVPEGGTGSAPLSQRLERAAVQFEADHPGLASSSRRLIDLLGKAGL